MSPDALAGMLTRNRNELRESGQLDGLQAEAAASVAAALQAQGGGGGLGATLPRRLLKLVASVFLALVQAASTQVRRHPRISTTLGLLLAADVLPAAGSPSMMRCSIGMMGQEADVFPARAWVCSRPLALRQQRR